MRKPTDLNRLYPVDEIEHEIEHEIKIVLPILMFVFAAFFGMLLWLG